MSPFFSSPEFIASLHADRERRLRQATRTATRPAPVRRLPPRSLIPRRRHASSTDHQRRAGGTRRPGLLGRRRRRRRGGARPPRVGAGAGIRQAAMDLAEQAACEVRAQLARSHRRSRPRRRRPVRCASPNAAASTRATTEELDARITLRVPPSLKTLIEDAAETAGASVNSWVLDVLSRRARKPHQGHGFRMTHSFDL